MNFDKDNKLKGMIVTHRIITAPYYDEEKKGWFVETKGDAAPMKDNVPIPLENIQGTIVGTSKAVSGLFKFITKWYGFVTVIVVPLLAILGWQIYILIREKTKAEIDNIQVKSLKAIEEENNLKVEEIKRKAIEEYENSLKETNKEK